MSAQDLTYLLLAATLLVAVAGFVDLLRNPPAHLLRRVPRLAGDAGPDGAEEASGTGPADEAPEPGPAAEALPPAPEPEPLPAPAAAEASAPEVAHATPEEAPRAYEMLQAGRVEEGLAVLREQIAIASEAHPERAPALIALERAVAAAAGLPRPAAHPQDARRASQSLFGVQLWLGLSAAARGDREHALPALRGAAELAGADAGRTLAAGALVRELWAGEDFEEALRVLAAHSRTLRSPQAHARTFALTAETLLRVAPREYEKAFGMFERALRETPPDRSFRFDSVPSGTSWSAHPPLFPTDPGEGDRGAAWDTSEQLGFYPQRVRYYREEIRNVTALASLSLALVESGLVPEGVRSAGEAAWLRPGDDGQPWRGDVAGEPAAVRGYRRRFAEALLAEPPRARALLRTFTGTPRGFRLEATEYGSVRGTFVHRDGKVARFSGVVDGSALVFLWSTNPTSLDSVYAGGSHGARSGHGLLLVGPDALEGYTAENDADGADPEGWTEWSLRPGEEPRRR